MIYDKRNEGNWTDDVQDWEDEFNDGDVVIADGYSSFKTMTVVHQIQLDHPHENVVHRGVFWEDDYAEQFAEMLRASGDQGHANAYQAASVLPPGVEQLEAVLQFLEEEQERFYEQLQDAETDDGSIPDDAVEEWTMAKGRLDQTRLFYGLVAQLVFRAEMENNNE